ncbi:GPI-anchored wall transfer protein 1 [Cucumispora dikerogammari]|nr:GPI-anchored wall transfer protein 1 [Cucumispora dikerogammari]
MDLAFLFTLISTTICLTKILEHVSLKPQHQTIIFLLANYLIIIISNRELAIFIYLISIIFLILKINLCTTKHDSVRSERTLTLKNIFTILKNFLLISKFVTIIQTVICILACDFSIFPNMHRKTSNSLSLMDTGVGFFIILAGFNITPNTVRNIKIISCNFSLGIARLLIIKYVKGLNNDYYEYGPLYNGYFLIGSLQTLFCIFKCWENTVQKLVLALILSNTMFPLFLRRVCSFRTEVILFSTLVNGLCLMLISHRIKYLIYRTRPSSRDLRELLTVYFLTLCLCGSSCIFLKPSRRHLNISYISSVLLTFQTAGVLSVVVKINEVPHVCRVVGFKAFRIFLVSNVLVLVLNQMHNLKHLNSLCAHIIMGIYLLIVYRAS